MMSRKEEETLASAAQIAEVIQGALVAGDPATSCHGVSTDSRVPVEGSLFVALKGPSFDGARFCRDAVARGSRIVLVSRESWAQGLVSDVGQAAVVTAADPLLALGALSAWHRSRFGVPVVAVTGSNGKTSTKQMVVAVLGGAPGVLCNQGNFNNQIGMPRALLELRPQHAFVVMEMGMSAPGEIAYLARIARPDVGVITNVQPVHLEGLKSIHAVAQAKGELIENLTENGVAVLNADDPHVLMQAPRTRARRVTFGRGPTADVRVVSVRQGEKPLEVELSLFGQSLTFSLDRPGAHLAQNAAAAAAVGSVLGVAPGALAERLSRTEFPRMRMEPLRVGDGHLLIDCYNANPGSMHAALQTLTELAAAGKRFAVLGEMRELGDASEDLHWQTGRAAAAAGVSELCCLGPQARALARGARENGLSRILETDSIAEATRWVTERVSPGSWVLIKGSRAMKMERIAKQTASSFDVSWTAGEKE